MARRSSDPDCERVRYSFPSLEASSSDRQEAPADDREDGPDGEPVDTRVDAARRQGYAAGLRQAADHFRQADQQLRRLAGQCRRIMAETEKSLADALAAKVGPLAMAVAGQAVVRIAEQDQQAAGRVVRRAVEMAVAKGRWTVRCHPEDWQVVKAAVQQWQNETGAAVSWEVVGDGAIGRGGCLVETDYGTIDARIERQLDAMAKVMEER